jgi:hypothetical protein
MNISQQFQDVLRKHAPRAVLLVDSFAEDASGNTSWYGVRIRAIIDGQEVCASMELPAHDVECALKCNDAIFYQRVVENLAAHIANKWILEKEIDT